MNWCKFLLKTSLGNITLEAWSANRAQKDFLSRNPGAIIYGCSVIPGESNYDYLDNAIDEKDDSDGELEGMLRNIWALSNNAVEFYHLKHFTGNSDPYYDHRFSLLRLFRDPTDFHWLERAVYGNAEIANGDRVLDLCCGSGIFSKMLSVIASQVDGIDRNKEAIKKANRYYGASNVTFYEQDVVSSPFPNPPYNVIVWFASIEHFSLVDIQAILGKTTRALSSNGVLIGSTPSEGGSNPEHKHPFENEEKIVEVFSPYFSSIKTWTSRWSPNRVEMYFRCTGAKAR